MFFKISPLAGLLAVLCLGCASTPPPEPPAPPPAPTLVNLQIVADKAINPDAGNKPAPVLLRIYELKDKTGFAGADYFAVFDKEAATLATDLVRKQEIFVSPGETKKLEFEAETGSKILGFFAAFRQLDSAQWRALLPINQHKTNSYQLKIAGNSLLLTEIAPVSSDAPVSADKAEPKKD